MGSNAEAPVRAQEEGEEGEIRVLVTGFGPFRAQNPINPAWEIAHSLPPYLPKLPSSSTTSTTPAPPPVRILVHPSPIKVAYTSVASLTPTLWSPRAPRIHLAIHIGMASGRRFYSIERRAHRDGYSMPDVDGAFLSAATRRRLLEARVPPELLSALDVDDVWRRWSGACAGEDVRVSEDAGRYLCDFIYLMSLVTLWERGEERRVLFLHVPVEADEVAVGRGVRITLELIRAMVGSRAERGTMGGGEAEVGKEEVR